MPNRLPKVFKNDSQASVGNNRGAFYSFSENLTNSIVENEDRSSKDDIENLFNIPVLITTRNGICECRIISKLKDRILTSSGERILLHDIRKIKVKDRQ